MGRVAAEETVENPWQGFGSDPFAGVGDFQFNIRTVAPEGKFHQAVRLIVFDRVIRQIQKQFAQEVAVALNRD